MSLPKSIRWCVAAVVLGTGAGAFADPARLVTPPAPAPARPSAPPAVGQGESTDGGRATERPTQAPAGRVVHPPVEPSPPMPRPPERVQPTPVNPPPGSNANPNPNPPTNPGSTTQPSNTNVVVVPNGGYDPYWNGESNPWDYSTWWNNPYNNGNGGNANDRSYDAGPDGGARPSADRAAPAPPPPSAAGTDLDAALKAFPQWRQADAEVRAAQAAYDAEVSRALAGLHASAVYREALSRKQAAQAQAEQAAHQDPPPTPAQLIPTANAALEAGQAVTKMERDALANDPNVAAAKAKLDAAISRRTEARQQVEASIPAGRRQ